MGANHNWVTSIIYWKLWTLYETERSTNWFEHSDSLRLLRMKTQRDSRDLNIYIDRVVEARRWDVVVVD